MDQLVVFLNDRGAAFCEFAGAMFIQTAVLIAALLLVDLLIRKRVRAAFRYWMWMLVFAKLLLPPTLALPTGVGYWLGLDAPAAAPVAEEPLPPSVLRTLAARPIFPAPSEPAEVSPALVVPRQVAPPSPGPALAWQAVVFVLWLVGLLVFGLLLVQRAFFVRGLVAQSVPAEASLSEDLERCAERIGVKSAPRVRISPNTFSPAVCGLLRPTILIPASLLRKLSADNLRAVLLHELAHIKRGDLWISFAQTVLQVVYFYNPLVWLAHALVRRVREQAVDEMVLVALGAEAASYSRTLIDIAEMTFFRANLALRLIGVAESKKSLEGRIKHMLTRPIPKSARIGFWGFVAIAIAAAVLLPMARARSLPTGDANTEAPDGDYKILLLDDSDDLYRGKDEYDDRLYLMNSNGHVEGVMTGFNICGAMGGSHALCVDERRKTLWVTENAGWWLWQIDLATGQVKRKIPGLKASAVAVDPDTGNAWVVIPEVPVEKSRIVVVSPLGEAVKEYPIPGFDIVYNGYDGSFWVVGKDVTKVDKRGNVIGRISGQIAAWACSVSVDQKTGNAWLVVRAHPDIADSKPEVWIVGDRMQIQKKIDLGDLMPFCVAVDSTNDIAWVGCLGATLRFTTSGEKLPSARFVSGFSVASGGSRDHVIAASQWELMMATVLETGGVQLAGPPQEVRDLLSPNQKWLATVSFAGAKLQSSPELAGLEDASLKLSDYPESREKLQSLGKALLMYANDYDDKFPDSLGGVQGRVSDVDMRWLKDNVEYVGKGMSANDDPGRVLAYDKTLTAQGQGTNVLYLDSHVAFESFRRLEEPGITSDIARLESARRLADLGKVMLIFYAHDHEGRLPERIEDLPDNVGLAKAWLADNVVYLGKGMTTQDNPQRPVAYDKTLLRAGGGTNVLHLNTQVVFVTPERLRAIGIPVPNLDPRAESRMQLLVLGRALMIYADAHDDRLPDQLDDLADAVGMVDLPWLQQHVTYTGAGLTRRDSTTTRVVAYDKTLLEGDLGTSVLYLDTHVAFETPERLERLGITSARQQAINHLRRLAVAAHLYANEHEEAFADDLEALRPYVGDAAAFAWMQANAAYLGRGMTLRDLDTERTPLAYWKTGPLSSDGTAVVFVDGHVEFVSPQRFKSLGLSEANAVSGQSTSSPDAALLLPNVFVMGPSRDRSNLFGAVVARTEEWTWNKTGRTHANESYDELFDGTHNRTDRDVLVLLLALNRAERVPAEYEDLLPQPWAQIEEQLRQGQFVELSGKARGFYVVLLAAPNADQLTQAIANSRVLGNPQGLLGRSGRGSDVAVEDFRVEAVPDRGTFRAMVEIRNLGDAVSPHFIVSFYRDDPATSRPMTHGAGPLKAGQTWNEASTEFALREGVNEVHVVLDPADLIDERDETNNRATLQVTVRDERVAEQVLVRSR